MTLAMFLLIVLSIASTIPLVPTLSRLLDNCTVLAHSHASSRARARTNYSAVTASNLISPGCTSGPTHGAS
jgi:hypothetical protein